MNNRNNHKVKGQMNQQTTDPKLKTSIFFQPHIDNLVIHTSSLNLYGSPPANLSLQKNQFCRPTYSEKDVILTILEAL